MSMKLNQLEARDGLIQAAQDFHRRGWMAGTAGNMSVRINNDSYWLTASGKPKGTLTQEDFVVMSLDGTVIDHVVDGNKPSAESSIHQVVYNIFSDAGACLHVHSVDAYIATRRHVIGELKLPLPNIEMVKGFDIWDKEPNIELDVFENHAQVVEIADDIQKRFQKNKPALTAFMIKDHGITVWGDDLQQAYNRVEILEFIMSFMAKQ